MLEVYYSPQSQSTQTFRVDGHTGVRIGLSINHDSSQLIMRLKGKVDRWGEDI